MTRATATALGLLVALLALPLTTPAASTAAPAPTADAESADAVAEAAAPSYTVSVNGAGTATYPAFDPAVERYAVRTTEETGGALTVTVQSADPAARVTANGRPLPSGSGVLTGLEAGDEVAVTLEDATGTHHHSFVYLPVDFPQLRRTTAAVSQHTPGHVLLTIGLLQQPSYFEAAVDRNGVPAHVSAHPHAMDLKRLPDGGYSVSRGVEGPAGSVLVRLDDQFREVASYSTVGLVHTDPHDSILMPDGSVYLLAYEPDPETGRTDSVVQHVSSGGDVLFEWNSRDHVDIAAESVEDPGGDYAHVNSVQVTADGHLLLSFRHLSSVFKVARFADDGVAAGDVLWKLGGRDSDFRFVDGAGETAWGPCAQHTATELPDGDVVVFDNGAWSQNPMCVDPGDPAGPLVAQVPSRVVRWSLDTASGVATTVTDHRVGGRYAIFAGGVQPLEGGGSVIGWGSARPAVASELDASGNLVWDLEAVDAPPFFTYRAFLADVPDRTPPEVRVGDPAGGHVFEQGSDAVPEIECRDRGGSSLRDCRTVGFSTTALGTRTFTVTARDGAGNLTTARRAYTVVPRPVHRPDAAVKLAGTARFRGDRVYVPGRQQQVDTRTGRAGATRTAVVRVRNRGNRAERFAVKVSPSTRAFAVRASTGRRPPVLEPGEAWTFRVTVERLRRAQPGDRVVVRVEVSSTALPSAVDEVRLGVRAG